MPIRWLKCYMAMYPRLRAEESLRRTQELFAADSNIEADARRSVMEGWQEQAELPVGVGRRHRGPVIDISQMTREKQDEILGLFAPMLKRG